jgi:hypothetical protein
MTNIWTSLRGGGDSQEAIRRSTAMTTVYLLEMNRKFEAYMRQTVETLEARVAAQEARTSASGAEAAKPAARDEAWAEEVVPVEDVGREVDRGGAMSTPMRGMVPAADEASSVVAEENIAPLTAPGEPETVPDYMSLLGASIDSETETAADEVPAEDVAPTSASAPGEEEALGSEGTAVNGLGVASPEDGLFGEGLAADAPLAQLEEESRITPAPPDELAIEADDVSDEWEVTQGHGEADWPELMEIVPLLPEMAIVGSTVTVSEAMAPADQAGGDELLFVPVAGVKQGSNAAESKVVPAGLEEAGWPDETDEEDDQWEMPLPAGRKGDWT